MMPDLKIESDPLFTLLTDALRAGPGSPQWSQAIAELRERGHEGDDYQSLIEARKNLESGREYRAVRAGAGFTRKVMREIDTAAEPGRGLPTANLVAVLSAVVIVAVLGGIAYLLIPAEKPATGVEQLSATIFSTSAATLRFDGPLPDDWRLIGSLPLKTAKGLRPASGGGKATVGGGIYWTLPLPPEQPTAIEATLKINRPTDDVTAQLFVTDTPDFSTDRGSSSHELVWQSKGQSAQVFLPSGLSEGQVDQQKDARERIVRLVLDRDVAYIDMNGKRLWSGRHQLATDQPRYVGVRLIRTGGDKADAVVVTGLRVLKP